MKYLYLLIETFKGEVRSPGLLKKLEFSINSLRKVVGVQPQDIIIANPEPSPEFIEFINKNGYVHKLFTLSRDYKVNVHWGKINILVEKIIQLATFDKEDAVLIDLDTEVIGNFTPLLGSDNAVLWEPEWPLMGGRNLGSTLPKIPFNQVGINFDGSFMMYNSGFVWIPTLVRKQMCDKALWITDYFHNGTFNDADRVCSGLDEQIGFSIVLHEFFGKHNKLAFAKPYINHYWDKQLRNEQWWPN